MLSFDFRGLNSYKDFGIVIGKIPPIPMPERRVAYEDIPGKNGTLTVDDGTYKDIVITVECGFISDEFKKQANKIKVWLMGGQDKLIFSDEADKYYEAQVVNKFDIGRSIKTLGEFPVVFSCKPFRKNVNDMNIFKTCEVSTTRNSITINPLNTYNYTSGEVIAINTTIEINKTKEFIVYNAGDIESAPIIKLIGTGDITLTINGESFSILDLEDYVMVDSEIMDCYRDTELMNNKMIGNFPKLVVGENNFSYDGNLTAIEILPNTQFI